MPELPEVETVRRILDPLITGRRVEEVHLGDFPSVLETTLCAADPIALLIGRTITHTARRGKYLFLPLDADLTLIVHLRMTGRLLILPSEAEPVRFQHLAIRLDNGYDLRFGDQRKFGRVTVAHNQAVTDLNARLGPEPDGGALTPQFLLDRMARRPGKVKNAMLDQGLIAGLGNIYVDEALFRARIHPEQPANSLTLDDCKRLLRAIRHVINGALANQGTTFSTFENPYGEAGSNAAFLRVYGKTRGAGHCDRCGTPLERIFVGGRGTTFCPTCQVLPNRSPDPVP